MSGQGRCVCGFKGSACKVQVHQVSCPDYAAAFRDGYALTPQQEYQQWADGGRKDARDVAHQESVADTDRRREAMAARFATRDILED